MSDPVSGVVIVTSQSNLAVRCHAMLKESELCGAPYAVLPSFAPDQSTPTEPCMVIVDTDTAPDWMETVLAGAHTPNYRFVLMSRRITPNLVGAALGLGVHGLISTAVPLEEAAESINWISHGMQTFRFESAQNLQPPDGPARRDTPPLEYWWCAIPDSPEVNWMREEGWATN